MSNYVLKLYIVGQTLRSQRAITNLRQICADVLQDEYELVIVDVLEQPQLAEQEKILATPALVRELPLPVRRIVGDLSDSEKVARALDLQIHYKPSLQSENHKEQKA